MGNFPEIWQLQRMTELEKSPTGITWLDSDQEIPQYTQADMNTMPPLHMLSKQAQGYLPPLPSHLSCGNAIFLSLKHEF